MRPMRCKATHPSSVDIRSSMRATNHRAASNSGRDIAVCRRRGRTVQVHGALFEPPPFQPTKLSVHYVGGASSITGSALPTTRRYTLTHNDVTGALKLSIGPQYNVQQVQGFYTRILRDEITAEWLFTAGSDAPAELHIYCHVSGEERWMAPPQLRNFIFRREMTLVLDTFAYADKDFLQVFPQLQQAEVYVHFQSHVQDLDLREYWGILGNRNSWRCMPKGVLARLKLLLFGFPALPHQRPRTSLTRQQLHQQQQQLLAFQQQGSQAATQLQPATVQLVQRTAQSQHQRHQQIGQQPQSHTELPQQQPEQQQQQGQLWAPPLPHDVALQPPVDACTQQLQQEQPHLQHPNGTGAAGLQQLLLQHSAASAPATAQPDSAQSAKNGTSNCSVGLQPIGSDSTVDTKRRHVKPSLQQLSSGCTVQQLSSAQKQVASLNCQQQQPQQLNMQPQLQPVSLEAGDTWQDYGCWFPTSVCRQSAAARPGSPSKGNSAAVCSSANNMLFPFAVLDKQLQAALQQQQQQLQVDQPAAAAVVAAASKIA